MNNFNKVSDQASFPKQNANQRDYNCTYYSLTTIFIVECKLKGPKLQFTPTSKLDTNKSYEILMHSRYRQKKNITPTQNIYIYIYIYIYRERERGA